MGEAYKCDRCGEYDDIPEKRIWQIRGGRGPPPFPHAKEAEYYLCKDCSEAFESFMED